MAKCDITAYFNYIQKEHPNFCPVCGMQSGSTSVVCLHHFPLVISYKNREQCYTNGFPYEEDSRP